MRRRWDGFSGKRTLLALLLTGASAPAAFGNPTGPTVASGSAVFSNPAAKQLQIVNSPNTIINWSGFSIGSGESTRFVQQNAASAVLNRVTGPDASSLLGTLSSNGRVFLINPNGILFGQGSVIDTAGFIASTLNMTDRDFLAGRLKFEGGGDGVLRNEGSIRARGDIFLVGPQIENAGLIRSDAGSVLLLAGRSVTVTSPDAQGVQFAIQAPADRVLNLGTIEAKNAIGLFAGTLRHSGDIRTVNAGVDGAGRVILAAQREAIVDGNATISTDNAFGKGGKVQVLGEHVGLLDNAAIAARGAAGGGEILVGGDFQGSNAEVRNAAVTYVGADTRLDASATGTGDGGKVIVWADDTTRAYGTIAARGGPQGGNGGFVETSGKRFLDVTRAADVSAPQGRGGEWLLDPEDITVSAAGNSNISAAPIFQPAAAGAGSTLNIAVLQGAVNAGGTVTLDTTPSSGGAGSGNGDITFNTGASFSPAANAVLNLKAHRHITLNSGLAKTGGAGTLAVNFIPNQAGPAGGIATILNGISSSGTLNIGGNVTLSSGDFNGTTTIAAGGTLTINSAAVYTLFDNAPTTNVFGTLRWAGTSSLRGGFDSTINVQSGGVFDIQNDQGMIVFGGAGTAFLNILAGGTLKKSAGSGTSSLAAGQGWTVNNAGLVSAQTGTLRTGSSLGLHSSTGEWHADPGATLLLDRINLNTGTTLTGTGVIKPGTGPFTIVGTVSAENFTQATGSADIGGAGTLNVSHQFDWTGGNIFGGQINIAPGANMNLNGSGADLRIESATINNPGTINWIGSSNLRGGFDSTINVQSGGVFDIKNDQQMLVFGGAGTAFLNILAGGTLKKSAGSGTSSLAAGQGWTVNNAGLVSAQTGTLRTGSSLGLHTSTGEWHADPGATLLLDRINLNTGTTLTGTGLIQPGSGPFNLAGAVSAENFTQAAGSADIGGAGTLTVSHQFDWTGGNIFGGQFNIAPGATMNLNGSGPDLRIESATINNFGTMNFIGTSNLRGGFDSTINVKSGGVFDIKADRQMLVFGGAGLGFLNVNAGGVLKKSAGAGTTVLSGGQGWQLTNQGKMSVESGFLSIGDGAGFYAGGPHVSTGELNAAAGTTFHLTGNQTHQLGDGARLTGAGTFDLGTGSLQIVGSAAGVSIDPGAALTLNSYSLVGAGKLVNKGSLNFNNSNFAGSFVNQAVLNVNGGTSTFSGASFDLNNGGTLTIAGGATLDKDTGAFNWNGGTLAGGGALVMSGGASFGLPGSGARILNGLTVSTSDLNLGGGSLTVQAGALNAAGTTTLAAGTLLDVTGGAFNAAGGTVNVAGTLHAGGGAISADTLNVNAGGTLSGGGAVSANVNNDGTVAPGNSPGTLTINGNYVQGAGGTLAIELGGLTQGVNYDLLQVTGTASLNGALNVAMFGGFAGTAGDAFNVMTYASRTGNFATFSYPAGYAFTPQPGAAIYTLALTTVPAPVVSAFSALPAFQPVLMGSLEGALAGLSANDARTLNDWFLAFATQDKGEDDQRKGSGLVCR